jgi:ribonuclease P protein component
MLNKENRLKSKKDFKVIFGKSSTKAIAGRLLIRAVQNRSGKPKFAFIISNKIEKRATKRNSLRRKLRAIAREQLDRIKSDRNILITVKQNYSLPYNYDELKKDLLEGLMKLSLLK